MLCVQLLCVQLLQVIECPIPQSQHIPCFGGNVALLIQKGATTGQKVSLYLQGSHRLAVAEGKLIGQRYVAAYVVQHLNWTADRGRTLKASRLDGIEYQQCRTDAQIFRSLAHVGITQADLQSLAGGEQFKILTRLEPGVRVNRFKEMSHRKDRPIANHAAVTDHAIDRRCLVGNLKFAVGIHHPRTRKDRSADQERHKRFARWTKGGHLQQPVQSQRQRGGDNPRDELQRRFKPNRNVNTGLASLDQVAPKEE